MLANINRLIHAACHARAPVFIALRTGPAGTRLAEWLHATGVHEIVIAGIKTPYCIDTTRGWPGFVKNPLHRCLSS
ncbi:isochorismatase family protein [Burkholderia stagnalis]|uniref:isochorismatase family protein n=1 Tax=Burkholderia stagnalis TaxID=1503054 RepID=UPI000758BF90|nr:isochorismatase family protein [Burkholderia stagnalis]KVM88441.1 hypothetical protein WT05_07765 [Burkholderia stagnalis]